MLKGSGEPPTHEEGNLMAPLAFVLPPLTFLSAKNTFSETNLQPLQPSLDPNGRCFGTLIRSEHSLPVPDQLLQAAPTKAAGHRSHYFAPLVRLLTDLFAGLPVDLDQPLHALDLHIALVVAGRKAGMRKEISLGQTTEELRRGFLAAAELCKKRSFKRIEENSKFVFKHTLKRLMSDFKCANPHLARESVIAAFYTHYFAEVMERDPLLQLNDFFDPLQLRRGQRAGPKTLSAAYLGLVFRSASFTADFLTYAALPSTEDSPLLRNYLPSIRKKLEKVFFAWERKFEGSAAPEATTRQILSYLKSNHQCKLPWSRLEVVSAIRGFLEQIGPSVLKPG